MCKNALFDAVKSKSPTLQPRCKVKNRFEIKFPYSTFQHKYNQKTQFNHHWKVKISLVIADLCESFKSSEARTFTDLKSSAQ